MVPVDNYRYKYTNTTWTPAGESDIVQNHERQVFHHPCSPTSGQFWMKRPISFKSIKITHYTNSKNGNVRTIILFYILILNVSHVLWSLQILLHTMHKYVMEIIVSPIDGSQPTSLLLPETTFVAVSAYQNSEVIKLKIDHNPFAKAFKYQDKAVIMDHFTVVSSPKGITSKQPVSTLSPIPCLLPNITKGNN